MTISYLGKISKFAVIWVLLNWTSKFLKAYPNGFIQISI